MPTGPVVALTLHFFAPVTLWTGVGAILEVLTAYSGLDQTLRTSGSWVEGLMHGDSSSALPKSSSVIKRHHRAKGIAHPQQRDTKGAL